MSTEMYSPAMEAVIDAEKPAPDAGGPCATCAFRAGTEANRTMHTMLLAALCVEGVTPFDCHEHPRVCRGWTAAVNLKAQAGEVSDDPEAVKYRQAMCDGADIIAMCIAAAKAEDEKAHAARAL